MSPLFDHQDYFGFKFIGEDFPDFSQPGFYFFANGGSDFVMPPGIFHVHEHLELKSRRASTSSYTYQPVIHEERILLQPRIPQSRDCLRRERFLSPLRMTNKALRSHRHCSYFLTLRWWVLGMRISSRYF